MKTDHEYILCAAIHYTNFTGEITHQVKNVQSGLVLCGRRHHNIIEIYHQLTGKTTGDKAIQGFLTSKDRFLTREEAFILAKENGQFMTHLPRKTLYSEDLY